MKTFLIVVGGLIVLYVVFNILVYFFQRLMIYHPDKELSETPASMNLDYEDVVIPTSDGQKLSGWFIPHPSPRAVLLYFHGNTGNMSEPVPLLRILHNLNLAVLIIDYRGYGRSTGKPSEVGTYRDAEAAWAYLVNTRGITPEDIVIYGCSLGGAIAIWLATQHRPAALVAGSTFLNIRQIARDLFPMIPVTLLSRIHYNNKKRIQQISCPVLIMHSTEDDLIPFEHGLGLFQTAKPPKEFLELRGPHGEAVLVSEQKFIEAMDAFLYKYVQHAQSQVTKDA